MNRIDYAILDWIPTELGGRKQLPAGVGEPAYSAVLRICGEPWPPPVSWTAEIRKVRTLDSPYKWLVEINYLVKEAPHHLLQAGVEFELYEGRPLVALGTIIDKPGSAPGGQTASRVAGKCDNIKE